MNKFLKIFLLAASAAPMVAMGASTAVMQKEAASTIQVDVDPWADLRIQGNGNLTFNIGRDETDQELDVGYYCLTNFDGELRLAFNLPSAVTAAGFDCEKCFSTCNAIKQPVKALVPLGDEGMDPDCGDCITLTVHCNGNQLVADKDYGQGWVKLNLIPSWEM